MTGLAWEALLTAVPLAFRALGCPDRRLARLETAALRTDPEEPGPWTAEPSPPPSRGHGIADPLPNLRRKLPRRTHYLVTAILGLPLAASLCGCGVLPVAARTLTAVEVISIVDWFLESGPRRQPSPTVSSVDVQATVSGTDGAGLWLNNQPGAERLRVLPEGASVTLLCSTSGPHVTGPNEATAIWDYVQTPDGATGFLSAAYLDTDTDTDTDGSFIRSC